MLRFPFPKMEKKLKMMKCNPPLWLETTFRFTSISYKKCKIGRFRCFISDSVNILENLFSEDKFSIEHIVIIGFRAFKINDEIKSLDLFSAD